MVEPVHLIPVEACLVVSSEKVLALSAIGPLRRRAGRATLETALRAERGEDLNADMLWILYVDCYALCC